MIRGKFIIVIIFGLALAATGFAIWYRYQQSDQCVAHWGPAHAGRIRNAPVVELWRIADGNQVDADHTMTTPDGATTLRATRRVLENIPDLTYIRRAFLTDNFFLWDKSTKDCTPQWAFALRFRVGEETTTLWIDNACDRVVLAESGAAATMNTPLLKSVRAFLDRHSTPNNRQPSTAKKTTPPAPSVP